MLLPNHFQLYFIEQGINNIQYFVNFLSVICLIVKIVFRGTLLLKIFWLDVHIFTNWKICSFIQNSIIFKFPYLFFPIILVYLKFFYSYCIFFIWCYAFFFWFHIFFFQLYVSPNIPFWIPVSLITFIHKNPYLPPICLKNFSRLFKS